MRVNGGAESLKIKKSIRITGTGAMDANLMKVIGQNLIISQYAILEKVVTLANLTGVYATIFSANGEEDLTADGAVLSGFEVGSYFAKDKVAAQIYTAVNSATPKIVEITDDRFAGRPFTVVAENGVDTFIKFYATTSDTPVDFTMGVYFEYIPLGAGSSLVFL
jgi:hypothetical protein